MKLVVEVPGRPCAKPRMTRSDKWNQRPSVVRYRSWADKARKCVVEQIRKLPSTSTITEITVIAYFAMPKTWSKGRRCRMSGMRHRVRPDADNILKAVQDALFKEDSGLADVVARKRWASQDHLTIVIEYESVAGSASMPDRLVA